jgi:sugar lactone lactonase YvrE
MKSNRYLICFAVFMFGLFSTNLKAQVISTYAGNGTGGYTVDGVAATAAELNTPAGIVLDAAGNMFIADAANGRVRKINPAGIITTIAGVGGFGPLGDGGPATAAHLIGPADVAVDAAGNVYIADAVNNRVRIVSPAGIINTFAGSGGPGPGGFGGDGGPATAAACMLSGPAGLVIDAAGNVYISDQGNNRVRMVNTLGVISTIAGNGGGGGFGGDGGLATAPACRLNSPTGLALDGTGNLYIADSRNNRIRKITIPGGIISTAAGSGGGGFGGDGGLATAPACQINRPGDIAFDASGNMYIADTRNNSIRFVTVAGIISTVVDISNTGGYTGDNGPAAAAHINQPGGLAIKSLGNYYISDSRNNVIRFVNNDVVPTFVGGPTQSITICESSVGNDINTLLAINDPDVGQTETWSVTVNPSHGVLAGVATYTATSTGSTITPTGLTYSPTAGYAGVDNFTVKISDGIGFSTTAITVSINPLPAISPISGTGSICIGSPTLFTDASAGGTWNSTSGNATVSALGLVSGVTAGTDNISYTTTNACGTSTAVYPVTVSVTVVPSIAVSSAYGTITCPGVVDVFTATAVNGGSSPTYQWLVNGLIVGTGGSTYSYVPAPGDVVSCIMTSSAVCAIPSSVTGAITMDGGTTAVPSISINTSHNDTSCTGVAVTYRASIVNGGPTPIYNWTVNGVAAGSTNPFAYSPADGDVIQCTLTSSIPCASPTTALSNIMTMHVFTTVIPSLSITANPGNYICIGTDAIFTAVPRYPGSAPDYTWTKNGINVATGPTYTYVPSNGDLVFCSMHSDVVCATPSNVISNTETMTVVYPIIPSVNIVAIHSTNIGVGQHDTLVATVGVSVHSPTYQWFVNGVAVPGAVNSNFIYNGTAAGTAIINCIVGSGDACNRTASSNFITVTVGGGVGIKQPGTEGSELILSPNPNTGTFRMNLQSGYDGQVQVIVTNIVGEKVKEFTTTTNTETEVTIGQTPGIYFLSATTGQGRYVAKVLVN